MDISRKDFEEGRKRRFGTSNPDKMDMPLWDSMARHPWWKAYDIRKKFTRRGEDPFGSYPEPVWCANRFGQSETRLPNGNVIFIGGEHEDSYDPDFMIYNDVFVRHPDGAVDVYGYPEEVFPPTDFHTATLVGEWIWIIGSLGYVGKRQEQISVYRLNIGTLRMEVISTTGEGPAQIYNHGAELNGSEVKISGGEVNRRVDGVMKSVANSEVFALDLETLKWRKTTEGAERV